MSGRGKPQKRSEAVNEQGNQCEATHSKPWAAGEETIRTAKLPTVNHGKRAKKRWTSRTSATVLHTVYGVWRVPWYKYNQTLRRIMRPTTSYSLPTPPCPTLWSIARRRFLFLSAFSNYAPDYFLLSPASPLHCVEHGGVIAWLLCFPAAPVLFSIVSSRSSALSATSNYAPNYFLLPSLPTLPCSTLE